MPVLAVDNRAANGTNTGANGRAAGNAAAGYSRTDSADTGTDRGARQDALLGVIHSRASGEHQNHGCRANGFCKLNFHKESPFF
jgi:hypothetical protein